MFSMPTEFVDFMNQHHILSLATYADQALWAANCFYVLEENHANLIILSSQKTKHGSMMLDSPLIAGTICSQSIKIRDIRGIQFTALARLLEANERKQALSRYIKRFPIAALHRQSDVWALRLQTIKYTSNHLIFGSKMYWQRQANTDSN
ncbi:hypothetical protein [Neisseria sp. Ec49-e6-T10]|uniref:hypothetical protein n=1 Tax=Neisseria sp. Ec49-e6-T10 TaxID=3140744 RepID=UPI003EBA7409